MAVVPINRVARLECSKLEKPTFMAPPDTRRSESFINLLEYLECVALIPVGFFTTSAIMYLPWFLSWIKLPFMKPAAPVSPIVREPITTYKLPDLLADFPWARKLSEFYKDVKAESSAWTESFHLFDDEGLRGFNLCDFNLLASLAYSARERDIVRLGCDLMNLFYVFDEYTDIADTKGAEEIRNVVVDAMRNPHKPRPEGELLIGEMTRDFCIRATNQVPPGAHCVEHFLEEWDIYTAAVVREADDRTKRIYRTFEEYLPIRRSSSGCMPSFVLCEFGLDLPEEAYHHPIMDELREQATDLIAIGNDIDSYAMEKARGLELHNSVELVMKQHNLDLQGSVDWLETYAAGVHGAFLENVTRIPSWGEDVDKRVKMYVDGLAQWIRGNDDWTFESGRYFGDKGLEIQKSRVMSLLPSSKGYVKKSS